MGIEPTYPAWKAGVLPLNYTRTACCLCISVGSTNIVYMMKLYLSTLNLNFFYFFNNIYKLSSDKQFCQADKIIRFAAQLYTE